MKSGLLFLLVYIVSFQIVAQSERVNSAIRSMASDPMLEYGSVTFLAVNLSTGGEVSSYNPKKSLTPASVMKVVTTAAALEIFGPQHRFITKLSYSGKLDKTTGVLDGSLYIIGGGDPTLGSSHFYEESDSFIKELGAVVKSAGINKITGAVIADDGIFPAEIPPGWIWGDIGNYYGAWGSGLSVFDNTYSITFKSGKVGTDVAIEEIEPCVNGIKIRNEVTAGGYGDNSIIYGAPYSWERVVRGTIPAGRNVFKVKGSIPDPALVAARLLHKELQSIGITIDHLPDVQRLLSDKYDVPEKTTLHELRSPTLAEIIRVTNVESLNPYAETLMNHIGLKIKGAADNESATEALTEYWAGRGVSVEGMFLNDGSGLSRSDGLSAFHLVEILKVLHKSENFSSFYESLPVAGRDGSLAGMLRGTAAEGNLHAKSGYMSRVRSYAGYVTNKKGEQIAFAIIVNNYTSTPSQMRLKMENVMRMLAE